MKAVVKSAAMKSAMKSARVTTHMPAHVGESSGRQGGNGECDQQRAHVFLLFRPLNTSTPSVILTGGVVTRSLGGELGATRPGCPISRTMKTNTVILRAYLCGTRDPANLSTRADVAARPR